MNLKEAFQKAFDNIAESLRKDMEELDARACECGSNSDRHSDWCPKTGRDLTQPDDGA